MTRQETESALKFCSEREDKCSICPYREKGCYRAVMRDSLRYIKQLKATSRTLRRERSERKGN